MAMTNEKQLRDALIFALENLQKQQDTISTLMTEIAALRDSLCAIGPNYDEILTRYRAQHARTAKPIANAATLAYDAIIQQLRTLR
jgi:hypothetical protein